MTLRNQRLLASQLCAMVLVLLPANITVAQRNDAAAGLSFSALAQARRSVMVPGSKGILKAQVRNQADNTRSGSLVATVVGYPEYENVRPFSLSPGESRDIEIYVYLPSDLNEEFFEIEVVLKHVEAGQEVLVQRGDEPIRERIRCALRKQGADAPLVAIALDEPAPLQPHWFWPHSGEVIHETYEAVLAARIDSGHSREMISFDVDGLPLKAQDWDNVDLLVLADARYLEDFAAVAAVRRFINLGGRVWIMLDRVDAAQIAPLLGPKQLCQEIDAVELHEFTVEILDGSTPLPTEERQVSVERPVRMKRVLQEGGVETHRVRGWPAAIKMPIGRGELILTTLEVTGLTEFRTEQISDDPNHQSTLKMRKWAKTFAFDIGTPHVDSKTAVRPDYPIHHLGIQVLPKSWVTAALGTFCLALCCLAIWRLWLGDLVLATFATPLISLLVAIVLLVARNGSQMGKQDAVAKLQFVEASAGGMGVEVKEYAAVKLDRVHDMQLDYAADGWAIAPQASQSGVQRLITRDFANWALHNSAWPAGVWRYQTQFTAEVPPQVVFAVVDDQGCRIEIPPELPGPVEDTVLSWVSGDPMLCSVGDMGLRVNETVSIGNRRWIDASIMSAEQQRRLDVYRELFGAQEATAMRSSSLYGWTPLWTGPKWKPEMPAKGSALVCLPVRLTRPTAGQLLRIPHGLIQLRQSLTETGRTSAFDDRTGRWRPAQSISMDRVFQFVIPPELLPIDFEQLSFELDIRAPNRTVQITVPTNDEDVELATLSGPSIPWTTTVTDARVLKEFSDGVLEIRVRVGDRQDVASGGGTQIVAWTIDHFHVSGTGHHSP